MRDTSLPKDILKLLQSISNKRARIVIDHILEHGFITTEQLEKQYGYNHPPRAARDVREAGIPLETFRVTSSDGRRIAAYRFGDLTKIQRGRLGGRSVFSKKFKDDLYELSGGTCAVCSGHFEARYLQIDHKIPYEVAGETKGLKRDPSEYMLLCSSCNRAKSWSCEHCPNWLEDKVPEICSTCYWGNPDDYTHIALREVRRVDILWHENEVQTYEKLKKMARRNRVRVPLYVKKIIEKHFEKD
jgi:5-methylcytosine-specific restriction endonuclease McrA